MQIVAVGVIRIKETLISLLPDTSCREEFGPLGESLAKDMAIR